MKPNLLIGAIYTAISIARSYCAGCICCDGVFDDG